MLNQAEKKTKGVEAVDKAFAILGVFGPNAEVLSLAEISRRTGLVKSTALRLLISLQHARMVAPMSNKGYRIGAEAMRLGSLYLNTFQLEASIRPALKKLVALTGESASFFKPEGTQRICLYREDTTDILREHVAEGGTAPLNKGAAGHVLIDFAGHDGMSPFPVRQRVALPYVYSGERSVGITGIAAPVFVPAQRLVGALALSGPASRFTKDRIERFKPQVISIATELCQEFGSHFYD